MKVKTTILTHTCEEICLFERDNAVILALKDDDSKIILTPEEASRIGSILCEMAYEMGVNLNLNTRRNYHVTFNL